MKKGMILRRINRVLMIALAIQCGNGLAMGAATVKNKLDLAGSTLKNLSVKFIDQFNTYERYKAAYAAAHACIQEKCAGEIEAMKKINEDMSKVGFRTMITNPALGRVLGDTEFFAQDNYNQCTNQNCKALILKAKSALLSHILKITALMSLLVVSAVAINRYHKLEKGIAVSSPLKGLQIERRVNNFIKTHQLADTPQIHGLLTKIYSLPNDERADVENAALRPLIYPLAELYYGYDPKVKEPKISNVEYQQFRRAVSAGLFTDKPEVAVKEIALPEDLEKFAWPKPSTEALPGEQEVEEEEIEESLR